MSFGLTARTAMVDSTSEMGQLIQGPTLRSIEETD